MRRQSSTSARLKKPEPTEQTIQRSPATSPRWRRAASISAAETGSETYPMARVIDRSDGPNRSSSSTKLIRGSLATRKASYSRVRVDRPTTAMLTRATSVPTFGRITKIFRAGDCVRVARSSPCSPTGITSTTTTSGAKVRSRSVKKASRSVRTS